MRGLQFKISQTDDYEELKELYIKNELEMGSEPLTEEELVKNWKIVNTSNKKLAGGLTLSFQQEEYIIDGIAIEPEYRKMKIGKIILDKAIEEVKLRGGKRILLVAKAPGFFRKQGFITIPKEESPEFFECMTCPQYGIQCHPEIMKLDVN